MSLQWLNISHHLRKHPSLGLKFQERPDFIFYIFYTLTLQVAGQTRDFKLNIPLFPALTSVRIWANYGYFYTVYASTMKSIQIDRKDC